MAVSEGVSGASRSGVTAKLAGRMAWLDGAAARGIGGRVLRAGLLVGVAVLLRPAAVVEGQSPSWDQGRCGGRFEVSNAQPARSQLLPTARYFMPLLADVKEPGFRAGARSIEIQSSAPPAGGQDVITAGEVALGGSFGLWRFGRDSCDGLRFDLFSGVFSQFNLDVPTSDLLNTDYLVGLAFSARIGPWSGRLRVFHQSSHLGDELLLHNPEVERVNLSVEVVDLTVAGDWSAGPVAGRLYAGGGRVISSATALPPGMARWGVEITADDPWRLGGSQLLPLAGLDVRNLEVHQWGPSVSVKTGVEWQVVEEGPAVRLLGLYMDGFMPFGQFFTSAEQQNVGAELQLIY